MKKVVVVVGPTASGKTRVSIELAKRLDGEIVSCDSMQIYKYMDIGTAKPRLEEMDGIVHHMIDVVLPSEEFSVAKYKEQASACIDDIIKRGKMPIVVGGTGLYANALIYNLDFKDTVCDWDYRNKLIDEAAQHGNKYLHDKLKDVDKESYEKLHENDIKRIIRALEVYKFTGQTITQQTRESRKNPPMYDYIVFGLSMDRERLYERINRRVDKMVEEGLVDEVKNIINLGYQDTKTASCAIGYKEIFAWLDGRCSYQEAIEKIKMESRRYAKRQITWFKRVENIHMINLDDEIGNVVSHMVRIINE